MRGGGSTDTTNGVMHWIGLSGLFVSSEFSILGFVPRPTRLVFDQPSEGQADLPDKRTVPTPPERGERRYKNNNHQDHHHGVTKVPVGSSLKEGEVLFFNFQFLGV